MKKITRKGATAEAAIASALQELGVTRDKVDVDIIEKGKKGFLGFGAKDAEVIVTVKEMESVSSIEEKQTETMQHSAETPTDVPVQVSPEVEERVSEPEVVDVPVETSMTEEIVLETAEKPEASDEKAIVETMTYITDIAKGMGIDDLTIEHEQDGKYISFKLESEKAAFLIGKRGQTLNALQQLAQLVVNKFSEQFKVVRLDVGDYRERREQSLEQFAERMADQAVRNGRKMQLEPMPSYERKVIHNILSNRLDIETYSEGTDPNRYLVIEPII